MNTKNTDSFPLSAFRFPLWILISAILYLQPSPSANAAPGDPTMVTNTATDPIRNLNANAGSTNYTVPVQYGGTGATNPVNARAAFGLADSATTNMVQWSTSVSQTTGLATNFFSPAFSQIPNVLQYQITTVPLASNILVSVTTSQCVIRNGGSGATNSVRAEGPP